MSERSAIEWTDASWNPVRARRYGLGAGAERVGWHCEKISPGCTNCYAERLNKRLGTGLAYKPTNAQFTELFLDEKTLAAPLRWRKPRRIFLGSMTDVFAEFVPDEWIDQIFSVMALAPQHTFQVLTKRAKRMREWFQRTGSGADRETVVYESKPGFSEKSGRIYWPGWPLPNVWLGISAEDQQRLDERVPEILATPAAVRFVSAEPLLGPIRFTEEMFKSYPLAERVILRNGATGAVIGESRHAPGDRFRADGPRVNWVIVGGESGPGARPMDIAWARGIVRQCREAGVAVFCKQLGANVRDRNDNFGRVDDTDWPDDIDPDRVKDSVNGFLEEYQGAEVRVHLIDRKGGAMEEWPPDLRIREFPEVQG